jgi:acyl transferase domain-containing protein/acyl carrier protein
MDPQHRIFLEHVWHALEDAGYDATRLKGLVGVYAGESLNTYLLREILGKTPVEDIPQAEQVLFGNACDHLATRVAYQLNLHGPALTIQSACSTSLVAIHQAYQALLSMQCDLAIAGGVSIKFPQENGYLRKQDSILSSSGHCRPFDAKADGTIFTNGIGVVVLKPLAQALADGNAVYAVIKGAAINNDGSRKVGYTAPSVVAQAEVIATAQSLAEINPETITYVEAHGTGTALGDPIEIAALTNAFRLKTRNNGFCAITSLKSNLGHLDAAAGVAGFIKTCLALQHHVIPPSLHFESPNPQIDFANSPFYVNTRAREWHSNGAPRRAGISSFGIGGTNAHVVLEEAPESAAPAGPESCQLLVFSARSQDALGQVMDRLASALAVPARDVSLPDVSYTLCMGRRQFAHRAFAVCENLEHAAQVLKSGSACSAVAEGAAPKLIFYFPGQMVNALPADDPLYLEYRPFREVVDRCWRVLRELRASYSLPDFKNPEAVIQSTAGGTAPFRSFTLIYSLATLFHHWGIPADGLLAAGPGKLPAGCFAGVFSLSTAFKLLLRGLGQEAAATGEIFAKPNIPVFEIESGTRLDEVTASKPGYWLDLEEKPGLSAAALPEFSGRSAMILGFVNDSAKPQAAKASGNERSFLPVLGDGPKSSAQQTSILKAVGELWLQGISPNWEAITESGTRRRCHLPGYPFERKRYWYEPPRPASHPPAASEPADPRLEMSNWFYRPSWRTSAPVAARKGRKGPVKWLIFADTLGIAEELHSKLRSESDSVQLVEIASEFKKTGPDRFELNPFRQQDYQRLAARLMEDGCWPDGIVHLWCLDPAGTAGADPQAFEEWQYRGLFSLMYLLQALGRYDRNLPLEISVLTTEIHNVSGLEEIAPNKATLLGAIKIIPKEYKHIRCRMIDFAISEIAKPEFKEVAVRHLLNEINSDNIDDTGAYRGTRRWTPFYEPVQIAAPADPRAAVLPGGNYLVLGALGTLGLDAAEFLASSAPVHLILVDKKQVPDRSSWEKSGGEMRPLIQRLSALEAAGARISIFRADFSRPEDIADLAKQLSSERIAIHGAVHAAGHVDNGIIELRTPESLRQVFAAKVSGAYTLRKLLENQKPDFVFLCSSMNPIIGSLGQLDKASANAFLDSFADYLSLAHGHPAVAVSWGAVDSARAAEVLVLPQFKELSRVHRMNAMTREESAAVYRRILTAGIFPRLVVSTLAFQDVIESWNKVGTLDDLIGDRTSTDPKAPMPAIQNGTALPSVADIRRLFADILGVREVEVEDEDDFFTLGGHSLSAIELVEAITAQFGVQLRLNDVYSHATAELLHKEILSRAADVHSS